MQYRNDNAQAYHMAYRSEFWRISDEYIVWISGPSVYTSLWPSLNINLSSLHAIRVRSRFKLFAKVYRSRDCWWSSLFRTNPYQLLLSFLTFLRFLFPPLTVNAFYNPATNGMSKYSNFYPLKFVVFSLLYFFSSDLLFFYACCPNCACFSVR